jgi:hypothetical protein
MKILFSILAAVLALTGNPCGAFPADAVFSVDQCADCHDSVLSETEPGGFFPHREISCLDCHPQAAQASHESRMPVDCQKCHVRHGERVAHDAHLRVSCKACHLKNVLPVIDEKTGIIGWDPQPGNAEGLHEMVPADGETSCRRCHHLRNPLGATVMVLPAKGILCLPCHPATFSVGDGVTVLALLAFALGLAASLSTWLSGTWTGGFAGRGSGLIRQAFKALFSSKILSMIKILVQDGLLQLRLYRQSPFRWLIHGLMVWPLFFRFCWGMIALIGSVWLPGAQWPWNMLDKNTPVSGFLFDLSGLMIMAGAVMAMLRLGGSRATVPLSMPRQGGWGPGLLIGVVLAGFVLEAIRMSMTGHPAGSAYAFAGNALGRLLVNVDRPEEFYGYMWYIHAVVTGAFVAYLPFGRMFHVILAPVVLAAAAVNPKSDS